MCNIEPPFMSIYEAPVLYNAGEKTERGQEKK